MTEANHIASRGKAFNSEIVSKRMPHVLSVEDVTLLSRRLPRGRREDIKSLLGGRPELRRTPAAGAQVVDGTWGLLGHAQAAHWSPAEGLERADLVQDDAEREHVARSRHAGPSQLLWRRPEL